MHSKIFKVSTAILNFYLPLLVLVSLNGRIYYEIKRRYKNVFLQRHAKGSVETTNNASYYNQKTTARKKAPCSSRTMTLCDSDRQYYSTTINMTDNDSLVITKHSPPKSPGNSNHHESVLRINFKEKKTRPMVSSLPSQRRSSSLRRTYSFFDKKNSPQVCQRNRISYVRNE